MAKLVGQTYEYAAYDDAQGVLSPAKDVPPTYPPTLDQYKHHSRLSGMQAFGSGTSAGTTAQTVITPPNATVTLQAVTTNASLTGVSVTGPMIPGGSTQTFLMLFGPGQLLTLPGPLNPGTFTIQAYTGTTPNATAFTVNYAWQL